MSRTSEFGTDFWNDSCDLKELEEALEHGAVGATSNPVIVSAAVKNAPELWNPVIDRLIAETPTAGEDHVAWELIAQVAAKAAERLMPEFEKSDGKKGRLSVQVNPKYFRNAEAMLKHAEQLNGTALNVAIKMPVVDAGLKAMEEATAKGIVVTPTVCFSVPQAVAAAEAIERGLSRAEKVGVDISRMRPNVAIMVGRLDDHLKRVMESEGICVDPGCLEWAGVAVFKKAYAIFQERGFKSVLLSAAYRNHMHWSEFIGGDVTLSIPYKWWKRFNTSNIDVRERMDGAVDPETIRTLETNFRDFRRAYELDGMKSDEFLSFGATVHTLKQFINSCEELSSIVRNKMIK